MAPTGTRFFTVRIIWPDNAPDTIAGLHLLSKSLTVKFKAHDCIEDIWKRAVRQFERAYGIDCPPGLYWSRLQTNMGGDLFMDDNVEELYRPDAPQVELQLRFVLAHIDQEDPLPPDSALRPAGFRKPEWSELTREEQRNAGKLHRWAAHNDPTPTSTSSASDQSTSAAVQLDADGFKIPDRPAKIPRRSRKGSGATAVQPHDSYSRTNSQATVQVEDSQPARSRPPTPISRSSPSQVSSNATPPSAQQPPDSQASQPPIPSTLPNVNEEDFTMVDDDPILDDELLGIESSQEQSTQTTASSARRTTVPSSHRTAVSGSSRTVVASSSRTVGASSSRPATGKGKQTMLEMSHSPRTYVGKGKQPIVYASHGRRSPGSTYITVDAFARMQQYQSGGKVSITSKRKPDQKWTEVQVKVVLDGVRRNWTGEQIRKALLPLVKRTGSSIRSKMKDLRAKIDAGTLSLDMSSPLAPGPAPSSQDRHPWTPSETAKLRKGMSDGLNPQQIQRDLFPNRTEESVIKRFRKHSLRAGTQSASHPRGSTLSQTGSQPSSGPGRSFQQSSPAEAASTRRAVGEVEVESDGEEPSSDDDAEDVIDDSDSEMQDAGVDQKEAPIDEAEDPIEDDNSEMEEDDIDQEQAIADGEETSPHYEDQDMIANDFRSENDAVNERLVPAVDEDHNMTGNDLRNEKDNVDGRGAPVDDEDQDIVFDESDMDPNTRVTDSYEAASDQRRISQNELPTSDITSGNSAASAPVSRSEDVSGAEIPKLAQAESASSVKQAKVTKRYRPSVDAPRKRVAYVAVGPRPDMRDVVDMRHWSAETSRQGGDGSDVDDFPQPVHDDKVEIETEPLEDDEDDEHDVIDIIRKDKDPAGDSVSGSKERISGAKRVFTSIPELETFTNRPSRDFVGVTRIFPDFTASLTVADFRRGRNAEGLEYTIFAPPYQEDEVLRPFHVKKSKLWDDALKDGRGDPAKTLEEYRRAITDNAMFKASRDRDDPRIDAIKKLRRWRARAKAREEGQDVDDAQTLSGQSDKQSIDSRECSYSVEDVDDDGSVKQQEVEPIGGGGYAETVASSNEEAAAVADEGVSVKHREGDAETECNRPGNDMQRTGSSSAKLGAAKTAEPPCSRNSAPQPAKASLKRKASTLNSGSEPPDQHALPSPQSMPMSPIKDEAGVPIPTEALSKTQVRRKRDLKRRKSSSHSDALAGLHGEFDQGGETSRSGNIQAPSIGVGIASKAKRRKEMTEQLKRSKTGKKRQEKREKRWARDGGGTDSSATGSRIVSDHGQIEEEESMLDIVRKAQHVPAPKPPARQPSKSSAKLPLLFYGDSEEDEESHGDSD